jgi:hypothetical protein
MGASHYTANQPWMPEFFGPLRLFVNFQLKTEASLRKISIANTMVIGYDIFFLTSDETHPFSAVKPPKAYKPLTGYFFVERKGCLLFRKTY